MTLRDSCFPPGTPRITLGQFTEQLQKLQERFGDDLLIKVDSKEVGVIPLSDNFRVEGDGMVNGNLKLTLILRTEDQ